MSSCSTCFHGKLLYWVICQCHKNVRFSTTKFWVYSTHKHTQKSIIIIYATCDSRHDSIYDNQHRIKPKCLNMTFEMRTFWLGFRTHTSHIPHLIGRTVGRRPSLGWSDQNFFCEVIYFVTLEVKKMFNGINNGILHGYPYHFKYPSFFYFFHCLKHELLFLHPINVISP